MATECTEKNSLRKTARFLYVVRANKPNRITIPFENTCLDRTRAQGCTSGHRINDAMAHPRGN